MQSTEKALVARGIDSHTAASMASQGFTLGRLKQLKRAELEGLGLSTEFVDIIEREPRPPIPPDTMMELLFRNRFQCCVCRDHSKSIIIHHIDEWSLSKNHNIDNLAVLCLEHHDAAHTKKGLSLNLTKNFIVAAKKAWEIEVKDLDTRAVLDAMRLDYSNWNFINELRVFEIAREMHISLKSDIYFQGAFDCGCAGGDGLPSEISDDSLFYKYAGGNIISRYMYVSSIFRKVIGHLQIINISDYFDKGTLLYAISPGDIIYVHGAHVFSPLSEKKSGQGRGQIVRGIRRANNVEVSYVFDRWEATSSSAKSEWLTGTKNQGSLLQVKDVSRHDGLLKITGTVLGICSNLGRLKTRDYEYRLMSWKYQE